jgi:Protein of unknown function (DUF3592)
MLKEFWTKMRGVDKWPEVQGTVRSVEQYDEPRSGLYSSLRNTAEVTFAYKDMQGNLQYGCITVEDSSSLYDAKENDTFSIRVDPSHPEQYYSPEATKANV